jgi:hypothetical protein
MLHFPSSDQREARRHVLVSRRETSSEGDNYASAGTNTTLATPIKSTSSSQSQSLVRFSKSALADWNAASNPIDSSFFTAADLGQSELSFRSHYNRVPIEEMLVTILSGNPPTNREVELETSLDDVWFRVGHFDYAHGGVPAEIVLANIADHRIDERVPDGQKFRLRVADRRSSLKLG